jgi:hypothetical protein
VKQTKRPAPKKVLNTHHFQIFTETSANHEHAVVSNQLLAGTERAA